MLRFKLTMTFLSNPAVANNEQSLFHLATLTQSL